MSPQKIEELVAKATQRELTAEEASELLSACRNDRELRRRVALLRGVDGLISLALKEHADRFSEQVEQRLACEEPSSADVFTKGVNQRLRRARLARFAAVATGLAALLTLTFLLAPRSGLEPVATIVRTETSNRNHEGKDLAVGQHLVFSTGLVEIRYRTGVSVVLEAPVDYEITGENSGKLLLGKLVAEVSEPKAKGFTVDGPSGRLVDLGTKFGIAVGSKGDMEVHVLEGVVDAMPTGGKARRLLKDEAIRMASGSGQPLPRADERAFVTALPPLAGREARFVRWNFDQVESGIVPDTGRELGNGIAAAEFRSYGMLAKQPKLVPGPYGMAVRFDGYDTWFESNFRGIFGANPRTVAFWMKVPRDVTIQEGYGIISWGNVKGQGTAWQISVNPIESEGPLGRLRVGTGVGEVVGTTDLRDDTWHHCAAVLYGDPSGKSNTSTHVLLYVDGVLEPAARKSVREINTQEVADDSSLDHGVWMGRNLAFHHEKATGHHGKFFRGDIDEMIISDTALSREEIINLMNNNAAP